MGSYSIIDYMAGLTGYSLDRQVLQRIAVDRHIHAELCPTDLTQRQKDLLLADILFVIYMSPNSLPSRSHQHGQFSMSVGQQTLGNRQDAFDMMRRLYAKWGDDKLDLVPDTSAIEWVEEHD